MKKVALITGVARQNSSFLSEFLIKGVEVHKIICRSSYFKVSSIEHLYLSGNKLVHPIIKR